MTIRTTIVGAAVLPLAALGLTAASGLTAGPAGASPRATVVKAVETDFHIALSKKTFAPGRYTFQVQNKGQVTHSLEVTGPGLRNAVSKHLSPGQSTKLTVTFKKGRYDIFCPIPGHKDLGMNVNLAVGVSPSTSVTSPHPGSSGSTTTTTANSRG